MRGINLLRQQTLSLETDPESAELQKQILVSQAAASVGFMALQRMCDLLRFLGRVLGLLRTSKALKEELAAEGEQLTDETLENLDDDELQLLMVTQASLFLD